VGAGTYFLAPFDLNSLWLSPPPPWDAEYARFYAEGQAMTLEQRHICAGGHE